MKKGKEKLSGWFVDLQMRSKIIVSIYLILLPIVLLGVGAIFVWDGRNAQREDEQLYQRFTQTMCDNIGYMQQDVFDIADYFAVNSDVHAILVNHRKIPEENSLFWTQDTSLPFVSDILAIKSQIKTLILYPENGLTPYYISRDSSVHDTDITHIRELPIYNDIVEARGDVLWRCVDRGTSDIYLNNKSDKMVAYRMLFDLSKKKKLGVLAIGIEVERYRQILQNGIQHENEGVMLLDSHGEEMLCEGSVEGAVHEYVSTHGDVIRTAAEKGRIADCGGFLIFCQQDKKQGFYVCCVTPKSNWRLWRKGSLMLPAVMCLLLVFAWPLSSIISAGLSRSVKMLLASMQQFQRGNFSERVQVESKDEIGQLSLAFNKMAEDTQNLIEKNYVMALREQEIELNALQAQINPHFLYNVLDSLYWEAVDSDCDRLGEDILALSELFRLLLSQGESEIEVSREIELISRYLQIQRVRFARRFSYEIDVDEDIMKYRISKLMLQPFVENAIVHGLERKQENGYVRLRGFQENGRLVFMIEDDGAGMSQEEADRLLSENGKDNYARTRIGHYAIRNIKERLTLRYGEDYTLKISSVENKGTKVYIAIPIMH